MTPPTQARNVEENHDQPVCAVRLFVAGDAPNSRLAKRNLRILRERSNGCIFEVEVVDVDADPQIALEHGIFVTPALQILRPPPGAMVFGNLSDHDTLLKLFPGNPA